MPHPLQGTRRLLWDWTPFFEELERQRTEEASTRWSQYQAPRQQKHHPREIWYATLLSEIATDGLRSLDELALAAGLSPSYACKLINELCAQGRVRKIGYARYAISEAA